MKKQNIIMRFYRITSLVHLNKYITFILKRARYQDQLARKRHEDQMGQQV
jgi:hypothetical protein